MLSVGGSCWDTVRIECHSIYCMEGTWCAGQTVSGGVSLAAAEEHAARKQPKPLTDFYRFQVREQKQSELLELRKDFSDAKKQLQAIRAARKFVG